MTEGFVRLTREHGYARSEALAMTPRELFATLYVADAQAKRENLTRFHLALIAAQGTKEAIEKVVDELDGGE